MADILVVAVAVVAAGGNCKLIPYLKRVRNADSFLFKYVL
jgi:hypothetical protein